jgi:alanine racemase
MKDSFYRPTYVEISLDALDNNIQSFKNLLPEGMKTMAVVKADAYGHGAVGIAKEAIACGVDYLGVAFLDEALELRKARITAPILVLGYTPPEGLATALENDITINVYSREVLDALKELPRAGADRRLKIHIKLDTGMGRLGLHTERDAISFIDEALQVPGVVVEGLFTHYANADETDKSYTHEQYRRFDRIVQHFRSKGIVFPCLHAGNSATAIDMPDLTYNMVRLGISMYGLYPSEEVNKQKLSLQPVLSLKTGVVHLKTLPPGSGISYGTIYHTQQEERIATLPIGYADGFSRMLTHKAEAIIRGHKVPVVGRICMDQCMIEVTDVPGVQQGDEVVLIGRQGDSCITAEDVAGQLGTVNYEMICMISHRVPRVYIRQGERVESVNPLMRHRF